MLDWNDQELAAIVGQTVREWRTESGLTLDQVAVEYLATSGNPSDQTRVLAVERGKHSLTIGALFNWAATWSRLLERDVTLADLFGSHPAAEAARGGPVPQPKVGSIAPLRIGRIEREVARKLGVTPEQVYITALDLWDKTFAEERNRRAGEGANAQQRGLEARAMHTEIAQRIPELDW